MLLMFIVLFFSADLFISLTLNENQVECIFWLKGYESTHYNLKHDWKAKNWKESVVHTMNVLEMQ